MTNIRHVGIYVEDIEKETEFYRSCFSMTLICENYNDAGMLFDQLLGYAGGHVLITKLISEQGKMTGCGEMIELIHVISSVGDSSKGILRNICDKGISHIAIGVDNIENTIANIICHGGSILTDVIQIGVRKCCFCKDPEGNGIELIE